MSENGDVTGEVDLRVAALRPRLNALIVCLSQSWGGLEKVAAQDSLELGAAGLPVSVLCLEGSPIHNHLARHREVKVIPLSYRPRNYFDFKLRAELLRLVSQGVNLIHTHQTSLLGSITPWFWQQPSVAIIATRHIMNNHNKRNFFHRAIYSRLDNLVVVSQAIRRNILETHPLSERIVKVVNLGLDYDNFNPAKTKPQLQREKWGVDTDTTVIGLVGRIDPGKGQDTFIKAAAGLLKDHSGARLKFVMVGEETLGSKPGYSELLREMVRQFHLEAHVVFTGFLENISEVMSAFDILVMPSKQEAFGLVAIEAMAMQTPVIISSGGSADEIVGDQQFGLIVRPEDAYDLQGQMRFLLDHPEERLAMGKRARGHVMQHYERKVRMMKMMEIYDRALKKRASVF